MSVGVLKRSFEDSVQRLCAQFNYSLVTKETIKAVIDRLRKNAEDNENIYIVKFIRGKYRLYRKHEIGNHELEVIPLERCFSILYKVQCERLFQNPYDLYHSLETEMYIDLSVVEVFFDTFHKHRVKKHTFKCNKVINKKSELVASALSISDSDYTPWRKETIKNVYEILSNAQSSMSTSTVPKIGTTDLRSLTIVPTIKNTVYKKVGNNEIIKIVPVEDTIKVLYAKHMNTLQQHITEPLLTHPKLEEEFSNITNTCLGNHELATQKCLSSSENIIFRLCVMKNCNFMRNKYLRSLLIMHCPKIEYYYLRPLNRTYNSVIEYELLNMLINIGYPTEVHLELGIMEKIINFKYVRKLFPSCVFKLDAMKSDALKYKIKTAIEDWMKRSDCKDWSVASQIVQWNLNNTALFDNLPTPQQLLDNLVGGKHESSTVAKDCDQLDDKKHNAVNENQTLFSCLPEVPNHLYGEVIVLDDYDNNSNHKPIISKVESDSDHDDMDHHLGNSDADEDKYNINTTSEAIDCSHDNISNSCSLPEVGEPPVKIETPVTMDTNNAAHSFTENQTNILDEGKDLMEIDNNDVNIENKRCEEFAVVLCDVCEELLNSKEGVQCVNCDYICHDSCMAITTSSINRLQSMCKMCITDI